MLEVGTMLGDDGEHSVMQIMTADAIIVDAQVEEICSHRPDHRRDTGACYIPHIGPD